MSVPRILVFAGSIRTGSFSAQLAALALKEFVRMDVEASLISLADYPMSLFDADLEAKSGVPVAARKLHDMMLTHRGIYIATPEYNASLPPLLKNTIDWLSRIRDTKSPFKQCVFALGSTSNRLGGGYRALMALRQVLELGLGALVIPEQVTVHEAAYAFDDAGDLKEETLAKMLRKSVQRLVTLANADL
ncbi:MAG TPA: NAD(P)H-dependent oxidoreductase [Xanthobacteraceae bacterium]|jgi:NAD(P)H-dependent FMN reductase